WRDGAVLGGDKRARGGGAAAGGEEGRWCGCRWRWRPTFTAKDSCEEGDQRSLQRLIGRTALHEAAVRGQPLYIFFRGRPRCFFFRVLPALLSRACSLASNSRTKRSAPHSSSRGIIVGSQSTQ